jgi:hypothetical protein
MNFSKKSAGHFIWKSSNSIKNYTNQTGDYKFFIQHSLRLKTVHSNIFFIAGLASMRPSFPQNSSKLEEIKKSNIHNDFFPNLDNLRKTFLCQILIWLKSLYITELRNNMNFLSTSVSAENSINDDFVEKNFNTLLKHWFNT